MDSSKNLTLILAAKDLASREVGKLHGALGKVHSMGLRAGTGLRSAAGHVAGLGKAAGIAALGGLAALGGALLLGAKAAAESQKIDAQTAAVIKSTGGAAQVTAKHVDELANSIKDYSGVDDDAVKSGANMLLTFTEIQNRVGKGNDIFDQATSILTDMSVAMGTDMKTQAIQLGKALNDPIKGVGALSKVGVTFTDQQKKQIAAMVKAGDVAGAQKVILAELSREFGGSAKAVGDTAAGAWNKFQNAVSDLSKAAGQVLLPVLTTLANFLTTTVVPAVSGIIPIVQGVIDSVTGWFSANQPLISQVGTGLMKVIKEVVPRISDFIGAIIQTGTKIAQWLLPKIGAFIDTLTRKGGVIDSVKNTVGPIITGLIPAFGSVVDALFGGNGKKGLIPTIGDFIGVLWGGGSGPLAVALKAAASLIGWFMGSILGPLINGLSDAIDILTTLLRKLGLIEQSAKRIGKLNWNLITGGSGGGSGTSGTSGARASGGPVLTGMAYTVGERGPETLVMGGQGGYVVPAGSGARPVQVVNVIELGGREIGRFVDRRLYLALASAGGSRYSR